MGTPAKAVLSGDGLLRGSRREWLLTNGLGGFAMGTVSGVPERRYHGWLVAALQPPVGRFMALNCCVEWLVTPGPGGETRHALNSLRFGGGVVSPDGAARLTSFEKGLTVTWEYDIPGVAKVRRELVLARHRNAAWVRYAVSGLRVPGSRLEVRPMMAMRDFHELTHEGGGMELQTVEGGVVVRSGGAALRLTADREYTPGPDWWRNLSYTREIERGQPDAEDVYTPGTFTAACDRDGIVLTLRASAAPGNDAPAEAESPEAEVAREQVRIAGLTDRTGIAGDAGAALAAAADQFVVRRIGSDGKALTSIIAGYPWFSDWGRDTAISLPGLLLTCGRHGEALEVLRAFASLMQRGLVPNCFDNGTGAPEYNTVDASLWYVQAACEYLRVSGDSKGAAPILDACVQIMEAYTRGTDFGIHAEPDGLICAGDPTTQLTWMDARRDGVVFTPRYGKAVEINALWCSGLARLAGALGARGGAFAERARTAADAFNRAFWDEGRACLYDVIVPAGGAWTPSEEVRPNQVFAASLPNSPLSAERRRRVLTHVRDRLLTPVGLRTLDAAAPGYRARYEGRLFDRDAAYHNGTVWPWLLGAYAEGVLRAGDFSKESRAEAARVLSPLLDELMGRGTPEAPVLTLAEVYDGDEPRRAQGCIAQAWSVAETLRVMALAAG